MLSSSCKSNSFQSWCAWQRLCAVALCTSSVSLVGDVNKKSVKTCLDLYNPVNMLSRIHQNSSEQPFWQATKSTKMKVWDARCHAWPQLDGDAFWLSLDGGLNYQRVPNLCYTRNSTWICLLHLQCQSICLNVASSNLQVSRFLSAPLEPCLSGLTCAALRRTSCQSCFNFSLT